MLDFLGDNELAASTVTILPKGEARHAGTASSRWSSTANSTPENETPVVISVTLPFSTVAKYMGSLFMFNLLRGIKYTWLALNVQVSYEY